MEQLLPFRSLYVYQIEYTNFLLLFELGLRRPIISEMKELVKRKINLIMKFLIFFFFRFSYRKVDIVWVIHKIQNRKCNMSLFFTQKWLKFQFLFICFMINFQMKVILQVFVTVVQCCQLLGNSKICKIKMVWTGLKS